MIDYREILRLQSLGDSQRSIALKVQSSRNTVESMGNLANGIDDEKY